MKSKSEKKSLNRILLYFFIIFGSLTAGVFLFITENMIIATEQAAVLAMRPIKPEIPKSQIKKDIAWQGKFHEGAFDLYLPENYENAPVLIFIPGGNWQQHNKRHYAHIGDTGALAGFITVILELPRFPGNVSRLFMSKESLKKKGFRWQQQFLEEAFRAVAKEVTSYKGDFRNLNLLGYNSGGYYAFMAAFRSGTMDLFKPYIRSVATISGITDLVIVEDEFKKRFIEPVFSNEPELLAQESPVNYDMKPGQIKVLQLVAEFDIPAVKTAAGKMANRLEDAGIENQIITVKQSTHQSVVYKLGRKRYDGTLFLNKFWESLK